MWLPLAGAAIFIIAAVTDALDGRLARRWGVVSTFGRVMDPFADKVLVLGAFVMLAGPGFTDVPRLFVEGLSHSKAVRFHSVSGVAPWMVVLILGRELLVTSLRGLVESRGGDFSATTSGKLKMVFQCVSAPAILLIVALQVPRLRDSSIGDAHARGWGAFTSGDFFSHPPSWCAALAWLTVLVTLWSAVPYVTRAIRVLRAPEKA